MNSCLPDLGLLDRLPGSFCGQPSFAVHSSTRPWHMLWSIRASIGLPSAAGYPLYFRDAAAGGSIAVDRPSVTLGLTN